jgi:Ergosterol biosynthesis ERG4/ERG24 family
MTGSIMSQQQLDRLERKVNRIGNLILAVAAVLTVVIVTDVPKVTHLIDHQWVQICIAILIAAMLLLLRRPFRH